MFLFQVCLYICRMIFLLPKPLPKKSTRSFLEWPTLVIDSFSRVPEVFCSREHELYLLVLIMSSISEGAHCNTFFFSGLFTFSSDICYTFCICRSRRRCYSFRNCCWGIIYILFRFSEYYTVNPLLWAFFQAPSKGVGGGRGA